MTTPPPTLANSVLLVIDVQRGFVSDGSAHVVPRIAALLARWQTAGGLSVLTQFVNSPDSPYVRLIGWTALMPGDEQVEFAPEIEPLAASADMVIQKTGYTGLTPAVREFLASNGVTNVWIVGLDTDSCVLATALSAWEVGLIPWIVTDAVASHAGPDVHRAGLLVAGRNIGVRQLVTADAAPSV